MNSRFIIFAILAAGFVKAETIVFPAGKRTPASQQAQAGFRRLAKGDFPLAESHFRQAIKLDPNLGSAYVGLAQVELRNDHPKLAEAHLRQAIASDPKSGAFQRSLAAFLISQDRAKEAEPAFRKAVELEPQSVPAWKELGDFLLVHQRNALAAAQAFESALKIHRSAEVLYSLGTAHAAAKNLVNAEAALRESVQLAPGQPVVLHSLGMVLLERGEKDAAIDAFSRVLKISPEFIASRVGRGDAYLAKRDDAAALADYGAALKSQPNNGELHSRMASTYQRQGQLVEAEKAWHAALRADADNPMALNNLAFLYAEQRKQLDQALAWAKKAVGVSRQAEHLDTLAWVHRARGEKAQALALLEKASATSRNAMILYHLGIVYQESGRRSEAAQAFRNALAAGQPFDGASDAKARLSRL